MNVISEMWRHYLADMNRLGVKFESEDAKRHFMAGVILTIGEIGKGVEVTRLHEDFDKVVNKERGST